MFSDEPIAGSYDILILHDNDGTETCLLGEFVVVSTTQGVRTGWLRRNE